MLIEIQGLNEEAILNTKTEPGGGGLRPFPCNAKDWTRHTACVIKASVKSWEVSGVRRDNLSVVVGNGAYGGEHLINLDPNDIPTGLTPEESTKAVEKNLKTLGMLIKILGAHTNGKLDTTKLEKTHGQCVEIICKHKGFRGADSKGRFNHAGQSTNRTKPNWDGREKLFHDVQVIITGEVRDITEVDERVGLPPMPGTSAAAPAEQGSFDDIAF